jgi:hypothetical protein
MVATLHAQVLYFSCTSEEKNFNDLPLCGMKTHDKLWSILTGALELSVNDDI